MKVQNEIIPEITIIDLIKNSKIKYIDRIPKIGIYFLLNEDKVVYVGQSVNIETRIRQHGDKEFDNILYIECLEKELNRLEEFYIVGLNPKYNKTHNAVIAINKYRLQNTQLTKSEIACICYESAEKACQYLQIEY